MDNFLIPGITVFLGIVTIASHFLISKYNIERRKDIELTGKINLLIDLYMGKYADKYIKENFHTMVTFVDTLETSHLKTPGRKMTMGEWEEEFTGDFEEAMDRAVLFADVVSNRYYVETNKMNEA